MKMKRTLLLLCALTVILFGLACNASAAEVTASGSCGTAVSWSLDSDGVLTVTGTGAMQNYNSQTSSAWYSYRESIVSVVISEGVTSIGNYAFSNCTALKSIQIPSTVTSVGNYVFYGCDGLEALHIPDNVQTLGSGLVMYCDQLRSISLGSGVTSVNGNTFCWCESVSSITVSAENNALTVVDGILYSKDMSSLIYCPPGLHVGSYSVPSTVNYIESYAFYKCEGLTELNMDDAVTGLGPYTFYYCKNLTAVTLSQGLTALPDYAFEGCSALRSVSLPAGLTELGRSVFDYCSSLETISLPDGVASIPYAAFSHCTALSQIQFSPNTTSISTYAFQYCNGLTSLTLPQKLSNIGSNAFAYCSNLQNVTLPASVSQLQSKAFYGCAALTEVRFTGDAPTIASGAFGSTNASAVLYYPYGATGWSQSARQSYCSDRTWQGYLANTVAGGNCSESVSWLLNEEGTLVITGSGDIGNYSAAASVTTAPWRSYASRIQSVWFDEGITSVGNYLFYGCSKLALIEFAGDPPEISASAFSGVTATVRYPAKNGKWTPELESNYGGSITWRPLGQSEEYIATGKCNMYISWELDYDGVLYVHGSFDMPDYGSTSMPWYDYRNHVKSVDLTGASGVGNYAFYDFDYLTEIILPESGFDYGIGSRAFYGCDGLTKVYLHSENTLGVGSYAFANCASLQTLSLSGGTTLGSGAFSGCSELKTVYFTDKRQFNNDTFAASDTFSGVTATVYYPVDGGPYYTTIPAYGGTLTWKEASFGFCGPNASWNYDAATKTLTVSGSGSISCYSAGLFAPWYSFCEEIATIVVENGITVIPRYAFEFCSAAESVILPDTLKSLSISAFRKCSSMKDLLLPASLEEFSSTNFNECTALTDVYYFGTQEEWANIKDSAYVTGYGCDITIRYLQQFGTKPTCTDGGIAPYYRFGKTTVYAEYYDLDKKVISEPQPLPASGHDWQKATCYLPKTCNTCTTTEGEPLTHSFVNGSCEHCFVEAVKITVQPVSVTAAKGETASVSVIATGDGLCYQWYYTSNGSSAAFYPSSNTSDTYSTVMDSSRAGRKVYCVITDQYGNSVTSETVTLGMQTPLEITKQPASVCVSDGTAAKATVTVQGDGLKYQWFYTNPSTSVTQFFKSSNTTATYSTTMDSSRSGRKVYCVITDQYGNSVQTDTVTLGMIAYITKQPLSVTVVKGATAKAVVTAQGDELKYQWYYTSNGSTSTFYKSSNTTASYSTAMDINRSGRKVYCIITDKYGNTVKTNTVTLGMKAWITKEPASVVVTYGATAKAVVTAEGEELKYQWYYTSNGSTSIFYKSSNTTASYSTTMDISRSGRKVFCIITDKYGNTVKSNTVTLGMVVRVTKQPVSVSVANGSTAKVTVTAQGEGLTYQWYYTNPTTSNTLFFKSSNTTASYSTTMNGSRAGRKVYCVITDKYGNTVQTVTVTLSMKS